MPSPFPSPCPPAVRGLRPRPRGLGRRALREQALVGRVRPRPLRACGAPADCPLPNNPPTTLFVIAPIPDVWQRFPPSTRSGWPDGLSLSRSSRRNAPRGPKSSRSRNLRFTPIPRGLVQSCYARGRRGSCAAPAAVTPGLYCGPRYPAIWHANAHQLTTSRGPRNEALRNSATPTGASQRRIQAGGR